LCLAIAACARDAGPAPLDTSNTACGFCRMSVSDPHFAAQIAAPGSEPVFFDDIGCLRDYVKKPGVQIADEAIAFVADHRTGAWVRAADAVFTRPTSLGTPMGGGLIAHADEASRREDPDAANGARVSIKDIFGVAGPPAGKARR
jgi:copper chaperone NosL